jgi:ATP-dependent RNA helicase SUPV3L1/SUV3
MLERLSDLIRPLVYWKPGKPDEARPEGSVEGGGFTVTPDMMSLVGCSGEEFSAILRALGFRADRRKARKPKPAAATAPDVSPETAPETAPESADTAPAEAPAQAAAPDTEPHAPAAGVLAAEAPAAEGVPDTDTAATGPAAPEAGFIEVWKPKPASRKDHSGRKKSAAPGGRKRDRKGADKQPDRQKRKQGDRRRSAKPAAPPPTDSPFAALSALKASLEDKQRTEPK